MVDSIRIKATGSVSNVACGFDCLGYSMEKPGDEITLTKNKLDEINITISGIQAEKIPINPVKNTAGKAIISMLSYLELSHGFDLHIKKGIPPGSGIGSSASSAVGAVFALNKILGNPLNEEELMIHAMEGEFVASGSRHADNVGPSLYGGMVLIRNYKPLDIIHIPVPECLWNITILPYYEVNTKDARKILPKYVSLSSAVQQTGNLAGFILGCINSDFNLISRSMEDLFAEPLRKKLIPGYEIVKNSAIENGAIGCGISGSGPSMFALSTNQQTAELVAKKMQFSFKKSGLESKSYVSKINKNKPQILD
ncbi:MAG: homoserine kinase [Candidatus Marinimicrobia bacterium]|nr:homoserine kinase [Candidatus Neomarinimicrobiota bacterium]|tara:strand:+ start:1988 stop:2920 length:933 start_codon:yes stop_codon:yes gene_type:complete